MCWCQDKILSLQWGVREDAVVCAVGGVGEGPQGRVTGADDGEGAGDECAAVPVCGSADFEQAKPIVLSKTGIYLSRFGKIQGIAAWAKPRSLTQSTGSRTEERI